MGGEIKVRAEANYLVSAHYCDWNCGVFRGHRDSIWTLDIGAVQANESGRAFKSNVAYAYC